MAETTSIAWTDYTFNPWIGCSKVAAGCTHCYAEEYANRYGKARWGVEGTRVKTSPDYWKQPNKWNRWAVDPKASAMRSDFPRRPRVFCASLADVFEDWRGSIHDHKGKVLSTDENDGERTTGRIIPLTMDHLRHNLFALIDATPNLDWLLLTKRPEKIRRMWPANNVERFLTSGPGVVAEINRDMASRRGFSGKRNNVWLLTSIATQADADKNIPELLKCRDLVPVLGVSAEPLIEAVTLTQLGDTTTGIRRSDGNLYPLLRYNALEGGEDPGFPGTGPKLDWVIGGLESGANRRDPGVEPLQALADQCVAAGVPFFCKQGSSLHSGEQGRIPDSLWSIKQFPKVEVAA